MAGEFELDGVVPWGRRLWEYRAFFGLDDMAACAPILDVGAGPSSFAAEAAGEGMCVVAADPLYEMDAAEIGRRFAATREAMCAGMQAARGRFDWRRYGSVEKVVELRERALSLFLADYEAGKAAGRYVAASLPVLPFPDRSFRLALVSHLLFLYGDDFSCSFHLQSLRELARVAEEVRVFPLVNMDGRPSSHLPGICRMLVPAGYEVSREAVGFEFQRGATHMLRVRRLLA